MKPSRQPRISNFGWDAVKLSTLSYDDLNTLRRQVEAQHANPVDAYGHPVGTIELYDKRGRGKLDALGWAVTYKLQEEKAKAVEGAVTQYRSLVQRMAAEGMPWHLHQGSDGLVLLRHDAPMDVHLPIVLRNVHAMSESQLVSNLNARGGN